MIEIWLWVVLVLLCCVAYWYLTVPSGLPPGTAGLPVVGYLPFMDPRFHLTFNKLGQKYGNIFHLYIGNRLVVILNDYTTTKEAFINQGEIFVGRPQDMFFKEDVGIVFAEGELWKQHRRFLIKFLRDYGVGKNTLGPKIMNEIFRFTEEVKKHHGKPFNLYDLLICSVSNSASLLVSGKRYDYDHPNLTETIQILEKFMIVLKGAFLKMFLPWVSYVPGMELLTKIKTARVVDRIFHALANRVIKGVRNDCKEGNRDYFIEAYLSEMNARKGQNDKIFTDLGLLHVTTDLIAGSSSTTSTTIIWAMLYLINYPDIQKKVQVEIDEVIGQEREPSYQDRINMPYTEATIYEVHRIASIASLTLPHRTTCETTFFGYRIPYDTIIFANLWNIHHDPKVWGDPENFRPERFLDENRQLINTEFVIPFSMGKRACTGEPLARFQVFLYIVSLLQKFDFVPTNGVSPTLEATPEFALQPKTGIVCAIARQK